MLKREPLSTKKSFLNSVQGVFSVEGGVGLREKYTFLTSTGPSKAGWRFFDLLFGLESPKNCTNVVNM
jgi:hypothetical protein